MPAYSFQLARSFADIALCKVVSGQSTVEDHQAIAYISRVSIELSLKALLEKAGVQPNTVRRLSHDLPGLLKELGKCKVNVPNFPTQVSAVRIRAEPIQWNGREVTIGNVIDAQLTGASTFPGQYRYGPPPTDYPAESLVRAAIALCEWPQKHWDSISI